MVPCTCSNMEKTLLLLIATYSEASRILEASEFHNTLFNINIFNFF